MNRALRLPWPLGIVGSMGLAALVAVPTVALLFSPYPALALAPGLLAVGVCVGLRYPHLVFASILLMIPFGAFRGPLQKLLAFTLLLVIIVQRCRERTLPAAWRSHLWPWLFAFLAVNVLSGLLSDYPAWSIENLMLLSIAMLFFALGILYMGDPRLFRALPALIAGSVSLGSLLGLLGFLFTFRPFLDPSEHFKRATGGTVSAPSLAGLIIFATPFIVYCMGHARRWPAKVAWGSMLVLNTAAIITTYSRGGAIVFVLLLGGIGAASLLRLSPRKAGLLVAGAAVLLTVALPLIPPSYWERQMSLTDPGDRSVGRRTSYLIVAADAVQESPILGHGPGAFRKIFGVSTWSLHFKGAKQESLERYAHNTYIEVLVGSGIVGLVLFLTLFALALRDYTRARARALRAGASDLAGIIGAGRLALFALLVYLLIYSSVYDKFLWVGLALSQVVVRKTQDLEPAS